MLRTLTLLAIVALASATNFKSCSNGEPAPNSVTVTGCSDMPCKFVRGSPLTTDVDFTAANGADTLFPKVLIKIFGLDLGYPLDEPDACKGLVSGSCPLAAGDSAVYQLVMEIKDEYPNVAMGVELSLMDQNDEVVACYHIDGEVVDA